MQIIRRWSLDELDEYIDEQNEGAQMDDGAICNCEQCQQDRAGVTLDTDDN